MPSTVGQVASFAGAKRSLCLAVNVTAIQTPPALATDGVPNYPDETVYGADTGACYARDGAQAAMLAVSSTAGSGAMTVSYTLWGYITAANGGAGLWFPITDQNGTAVNFTASVSPLKANTVFETRRYWNTGCFDRLAVTVTAIGGTATAIEAWINTSRVNS